MRKYLIAAALTALAAAALVPAVEGQTTTTLKASMSGRVEVPKGDPDGKGTATIRLTARRVCFTIRTENVDPIAAGHIHKGARGAAGPVVVTLISTVSSKATRTGCSGASKGATARVIRAIKAKPGSYYVNVHNAKYPAGAIRGQLHR
jgi:hypothetical protein